MDLGGAGGPKGRPKVHFCCVKAGGFTICWCVSVHNAHGWTISTCLTCLAC
uniref:Uncharacterized protein n=1 Tax=Anguilla anguilla TaxID=7936 RepID=A0A0E9QNE7_ANGAN